jgi:hypothetical protein
MRRPRPTLAIAAVSLVLLAGACDDTDGGDGATPSSTGATDSTAPVSPVDEPSGIPSPTQPALPADPPPTSGPEAAGCVNGWTTPPEDTPRYLQPLGIIRRSTGVEGPLRVVDLRYFEGPESPPTDKGYLLVVERWYVKLFAENDLGFQGRFLVEARRFGRGLAAVAPYDTSGFASPDWVGFQFDSADLEARAYEGLPGVWSGEPYDFVGGGAGLRIPGLPEDVVGCLDGT